MNNNILYLAIGALAVAVVGLGYYFYQDQQSSPAGVQITVSKPFLGDHRDHSRDRDRGHGDQHGGDRGNDNGGHDQKGPQPNE